MSDQVSQNEIIRRYQESPASSEQPERPDLGLLGETQRFAGIAGRSFLAAAVQDPVNGITQLINRGTSTVGIPAIPELSLVERPTHQAALGSSDWFAETLGSGAGMVLPFLAARGAVGRIGQAAPVARYASMAERIPMASTLKPALGGAAYGFFLTPSQEGGNFWEQRVTSGLVNGVTFGAQHAFTSATMSRLGRAGLPLSSAEFQNSLLGYGTRIGANAWGGSLAGVVNAGAMTALTGQEFNQENVLRAVASNAVTGGFLDVAQIAGARAMRPTRSPAPEAVPEQASSPDAAVPESLPEVARVATAFEGAIKRAFGDGPEAARHTEQVNKLLTDLIQRPDNFVTGRQELVQTVEAVNRLLSADQLAVDLTPAQRVGLAKQLLFEGGRPLHADQGLNNCCGPIVAQEIMQLFHPGKATDAVVQLVTTGQYTSGGDSPITVRLDQQSLAGLPEGFRNPLAPDIEAQRSLQRADSPASTPKVDGERSYASQLLQLLIANAHTQSMPEPAVYVKGRPDARVAADTGERLFQLDASGTWRAATDAQGNVRNGPGLAATDVQPVVDRLIGQQRGVSDPFVVMRRDQPVHPEQGIAIQSESALERVLLDRKGVVALEVNPDHPIFNSGVDRAATTGGASRHLLLAEVLRDGQGNPIRDPESNSPMVQLYDQFGRRNDLVGDRAVPLNKVYDALAVPEQAPPEVGAGRLHSLQDAVESLDRAARQLAPELAQKDKVQWNTYNLINRRLREMGLSAAGWDVYPTQPHSPADAIGADFLMVNRFDGRMHLLDATARGGKEVPAVRQSGIITVEARWFDMIGGLKIEDMPEAARFYDDLTVQLSDLAAAPTPFNVRNSSFPDARLQPPEVKRAQVQEFIRWLRDEASETGDTGYGGLADYAGHLENNALRYLDRTAVQSTSQHFRGQAEGAARSAITEYVIARLSGRRGRDNPPKHGQSDVSLIKDKLDVTNDAITLKASDGQVADIGNVSDLVEKVRRDLLNLNGSEKPNRRNHEPSPEELTRQKQLARLEKTLGQRGLTLSEFFNGLIRFQQEIRIGGRTGSGPPSIFLDMVESLRQRPEHQLLNTEPPPPPEPARGKNGKGDRRTNPDRLTDQMNQTKDVLAQLEMSSIGKDELVVAMDLTVSTFRDSWTPDQMREYTKLRDAIEKGDTQAARRAYGLLGLPME